MTHRIRHRTVYEYAQPVRLSHHRAVLAPREAPGQVRRAHRLTVDPAPTRMVRRLDYFGNEVTLFDVGVPHRRLVVEAESEVELGEARAIALMPTPPWETVRDRLSGALEQEYAFDSPLVAAGDELAAFAAPSFLPGRPLLEALRDLATRIHREFAFDDTATSVATPIAEVLRGRRGVCQDFAHLGIGALRSLGLAARYVSGYLETLPPAGQERLVGADASHAWLAAFCPGLGWIDIDPTNDLIPTFGHITVAWGRDFHDVSPLKGVILGGGRQSVSVAVDVLRT